MSRSRRRAPSRRAAPRPASRRRSAPRRRNVIVRREGPVAVLELNRPRVRNAIDRAMVADLHAALDQLSADRSLRVLVLIGAGGAAFAAGADIRELRRRRAADALDGINSSLFARLERFPVPTIAAIQGVALGGGCELALACDLRVAGRSARLGQPEVGLGIIPAAGATLRLPRLVGMGRARELILTGRVIDADEALSIGLVNRVVADDRVRTEALLLARTLAARSPAALRIARLVLMASACGAEAGDIAERLGQGILFSSADRDEGMAAFLERRRPRFRGR